MRIRSLRLLAVLHWLSQSPSLNGSCDRRSWAAQAIRISYHMMSNMYMIHSTFNCDLVFNISCAAAGCKGRYGADRLLRLFRKLCTVERESRCKRWAVLRCLRDFQKSWRVFRKSCYDFCGHRDFQKSWRDFRFSRYDFCGHRDFQKSWRDFR